MEKDEQRNFIIAALLMMGLLFLYQVTVAGPQQRYRAAQPPAASAGTVPGAALTEPGTPGAAKSVADLAEARALSPRATFDAQAVQGSIRLAGARLDDVSLKQHFIKVDRTEPIHLLRPEESPFGFFATYYWADGNQLIAGRASPWKAVVPGAVTPGAPLKLRLEAEGVTIDREIRVDDHFMFTFRDTVTNTSAAARTLRPIGSIERQGRPEGFITATDPSTLPNDTLAHMGLMGSVNGKLILQKYKPLFEQKKLKTETANGLMPLSRGGWWALSDKFWFGALVPDQTRAFTPSLNRARLAGGGPLELVTDGEPFTLAPGARVTTENRIFAGAKRLSVLESYQKTLGITAFSNAIDWGWAYVMTKPFYYVLNWLYHNLGSIGLAILALTVLIKLPLVPLFNTSYKSLAKMKKLQEPMAEIRERFKNDPQKQQAETLKLMQSEGANPLAGCLPIFFTIPIFYALYKTLYICLEMRHAPFLFMKDLSAPDPTALINLFGLLPFDAAGIKAIPLLGVVIGIGILPLLYGLTMFILQTLSPPPPDKMQANILMAMPLIFMFVFANFAAGLVMYWVWSNILSFIQQYAIMRANGVETEVGKFAKRLFSGNKASAREGRMMIR